MNKLKVKSPRLDFQREIEFTDAYRRAKKQYAHPAQIEISCLRAQYPAMMHPIEDSDLLAGRMEYGCVGFGIQHQTGGFGFFCDDKRLTWAIENQPGTGKYREDLLDMLNFWRAENTSTSMMRELPDNLRKALPSDDWLGGPHPATPILRMAGAYVDYDKLCRIGIPGLILEVKSHKERMLREGGDLILFDCLLDTLDLFKDVCRFYIQQAKELMKQSNSLKRKAELDRIADALTNIQFGPPANMIEALQLVWLYSLMGPLIEFGRVDEYLGDFYVNDIKNGTLNEEEALLYLQSFFRLIDHLDCETDGRVIVGGYGRRNHDNADKFCLVAIEACRTVREVLPQFTLRFSKETPKEVWDSAMKCILEGRTYPLLYNDDVLIPCIIKAYGVDRKLAESYVPLGCGEIEFNHYSIHTPSGALNLLKTLEVSIHGGFEPIEREWRGIRTKPLVDCTSFDEFYEQYKKQLTYYIEAQADFEVYEYEQTGKRHSFMMVSMLYDDCLKKGKSIFNGGCASLNGTLELYGLINAGDSLTAIKKLVFEDKTISAEQLLQALEDNFVGHESLRKMLIDCPKYGNDNPIADQMLIDLQKFTCGTIKEQASRVGLDSYLAVVINNAQNTTLARWVGASPDGRKCGMPMANANNPSPGMDKHGITAMLNSILKMPHDNNAGTVQNIRFTRELFSANREKMFGLIDGYFSRGGAHAMITVIGKDELQSALEKPEEYHDLIVRVGGFSARFVDLPKDVQMEIYSRVSY